MIIASIRLNYPANFKSMIVQPCIYMRTAVNLPVLPEPLAYALSLPDIEGIRSLLELKYEQRQSISNLSTHTADIENSIENPDNTTIIEK
jgi:hypothetical protein